MKSMKNLDAYRNAYHESKYNTELLVNTKESQKKYLQFMKELLEKEPNVAIELLSNGLEELGFKKARKDIKKLVKGK